MGSFAEDVSKIYVFLISFIFAIMGVYGHGRLLEPPSRGSMWRLGYDTPPNYNDNAQYCGGFQVQWGRNGGKCGVCGDPYDGKRDHEAGGKFATGKIVRTYRQGQVIDITVEVTANHKGWFEFRLCPNNNPKRRVTHQCLDRYLLKMANGRGTKHILGERKGMVKLRYKLPPDVVCSQCVLQWKWTAGNSWGVDVTSGKGCVGCGAQEQFYGCADIAINRDGRNSVQFGHYADNYDYPSYSTPGEQYTTKSDAWLQMGFTYPKDYMQPRMKAAPSSKLKTWIRSERRVTVKIPKNCRSYGEWAGQQGMDSWCTLHCTEGFCPESHCKCDWIEIAMPPLS